jgi:hypothetical protein
VGRAAVARERPWGDEGWRAMTDAGRSIETSQQASSDSAIIATGAEGLSLSIGPGGLRGGGLFFSIWLSGWLFGEIVEGRFVLRSRAHIDLSLLPFHFPAFMGTAFPVIWLTGWTIAGYYAVARWLFAFWGHRELIVGTSSISLRASMFGQSRTTQFDLQRVENVRMVVDAAHARQSMAISQMTSLREQLVSSELPNATLAEVEHALEPRLKPVEEAASKSIWSIAFDVGGKTYGFGAGLSPTTCRTIQDAIERSRSPTAKVQA